MTKHILPGSGEGGGLPYYNTCVNTYSLVVGSGGGGLPYYNACVNTYSLVVRGGVTSNFIYFSYSIHLLRPGQITIFSNSMMSAILFTMHPRNFSFSRNTTKLTQHFKWPPAMANEQPGMAKWQPGMAKWPPGRAQHLSSEILTRGTWVRPGFDSPSRPKKFINRNKS